jgi:glutamate receptor ionotropic, NMDA 3A
MADSPILDYYRGSDHGCQLRRIGESYIEDTYAIGMSKGFPLKDSISALIAKYSSNGYLDILVEKWYGGLPCYRDEDHIEIVQPRPLGVAAVAGVYLMLGLGMILGVLILIFEHTFFKYYLPALRQMPKGSVWRSRNVMFFSQVASNLSRFAIAKFSLSSISLSRNFIASSTASTWCRLITPPESWCTR